jgi:hypothetical protein
MSLPDLPQPLGEPFLKASLALGPRPLGRLRVWEPGGYGPPSSGTPIPAGHVPCAPRFSPRSNAPPSAHSTSLRPAEPPQEELGATVLGPPRRASPLFSTGIAVPAIAKPLNPFGLVTPCDLPNPLLGVAHHPRHLAHRITQRHAPDHQQVSTQHWIFCLAVEPLQPRGLRSLPISFLAHARKYINGFRISLGF